MQDSLDELNTNKIRALFKTQPNIYDGAVKYFCKKSR